MEHMLWRDEEWVLSRSPRLPSEFLLDIKRQRWPFGHEGELEVSDNLIDNFMIFNERDDLHLASTGRAKQRINFIHLANHLSPAF
jgi:hypothetical protein